MKIAVAAIAVAFLISGCGTQPASSGTLQVAGGDSARGKAVLAGYGCGSCHVIPGVANAKGNVGPPLAGIANRRIIGGYLPNSTDSLVRWIQHPQTVAPGNAMPDMGVTDEDALDMAAYLATLR
jgi:cytochrome c